MSRTGAPRIPIEDRMARRTAIDPQTGCHVWTGARWFNGYGLIKAPGRGRALRTHRVAYELAKGPIPDGLQIDHLCRNRLCCNPDHLEAVTRLENMARGNAPHILNAKKTHCQNGHPFDAEHTVHRILRGRPSRSCRTCARAKRLARAALKEQQQ